MQRQLFTLFCAHWLPLQHFLVPKVHVERKTLTHAHNVMEWKREVRSFATQLLSKNRAYYCLLLDLVACWAHEESCSFASRNKSRIYDLCQHTLTLHKGWQCVWIIFPWFNWRATSASIQPNANKKTPSDSPIWQAYSASKDSSQRQVRSSFLTSIGYWDFSSRARCFRPVSRAAVTKSNHMRLQH